MATFVRYSNNGVVALMTRSAYDELVLRYDSRQDGEDVEPVYPVFTFSSPDHPSIGLMTGNRDDMVALLEDHTVVSGGLYVPFSNGIEGWGQEEEKQAELAYQTTPEQVLEAFGRRL